MTPSPHQGPRQRPRARSGAPAAGRVPRRHWWALAALLVPLLFCAVVGVGVFLMFHRQMAFFRPAPVGLAAPPHAPLAACPHAGKPLRVRGRAGPAAA